MVRLKLWQWAVLGLPIAGIIGFLLIASGMQIHAWGLSWIWAIFTLLLVGWRFLLVKWTRPVVAQLESVMTQVTEELEASSGVAVNLPGDGTAHKAETALQQILLEVQTDPPLWEDWATFWQRCQELVSLTAQVYYPEVKRPLLNIYIPQAYTLIRGTVDDMDQWMEKLSPALNQVTVAQAVEAYEVYRRLEPSARKLWRVWNWAQWLLNPAAAVARQASKGYSNQASQQLLVNLGQLLKEATLRNLSHQAISLYSGNLPTLEAIAPTLAIPVAKTQTLQEILAQAEPVEKVEQKPVSILLVGRTGAGKSSLINTLFVEDKAAVDLLPSTDALQDYSWKSTSGDALTLWDTPGYEQANRADFRDLVLDRATQADVLLLVTPALDPALQMDVDFLKDVKAVIPNLPAIAAVTQVDKLRPIREWNPPYDWQWGDSPKETAIREATQYRATQLDEFCNWVLPVVTGNTQTGRMSWGMEALSLGLIEAIAPAKQLRLARFLRNLEARTISAAKIIDRYTFQMATTQGLTALLKSPVLTFLATLTTGTPTVGYLLSEQIPIEQLPVVIGKLQMAYDLFSLLSANNPNAQNFDLLAIWSILQENTAPPERNAWAFGHAMTEYWTQSLSAEQLQQRFQHYLNQGNTNQLVKPE
jgi:predicted GTPase